MWYAVINHIDIRYIYAERFLGLDFNEAVIDELFMKLPQIWHTHKNCNLYDQPTPSAL